MSFGRILFAVDGSDRMRAALPAVARLATATGARVTVLRVVTGDDPVPAVVEELPARLRELGVEADLEVRAARPGEVAGAIVRAASELHSDLLALGSRGLSDLSGLFHGSVSHRVIAASDCPVLVIRYGSRRETGRIRRILLAVAGGDEVPHALHAAITIARATGAEVLVLHARYLITGMDNWPFVAPDDYAQKQVLTVVRRLHRAGIRAAAHQPVAVEGTAHELAAEARRWEADLIVVGSRRLSDLASLLLGGVDHELVHLTDRPVLVAARPEPLAAGRAAAGR